MQNAAAKPVIIEKVIDHQRDQKLDLLATEEPLEIKLGFGPKAAREQRNLAITMRTPGNDTELVLGFLFTEGIINSMSDVLKVEHCTDAKGDASNNVIRAELSPNLKLDWSKFQRHFYTNSSCGVCGKASIESLYDICETPIKSTNFFTIDQVHSLNNKMRETQNVFEHTGGLHASALFNSAGDLVYLREDIGRHNALDKIIGIALHEGLLPLSDSLIMLSGRCCFELVQKTLRAGCPILCAVGAPSSLAVETADEFRITLIGFARNQVFNLYSNPQRIQ
ncbi:formate dehydrogenase accessory sulfurtransferase FdhD [Salibacteraceae bacterium]|nr:formate dehydrogenase accessory sulfurtransferase FdhD [Salibacteraceae bacterium]